MKWISDDHMGEWEQKYFQTFVLEGLRRNHIKLLSYSKLSLVMEGVEKFPPHFQKDSGNY